MLEFYSRQKYCNYLPVKILILKVFPRIGYWLLVTGYWSLEPAKPGDFPIFGYRQLLRHHIALHVVSRNTFAG